MAVRVRNPNLQNLILIPTIRFLYAATGNLLASMNSINYSDTMTKFVSISNRDKGTNYTSNFISKINN